ncbi:hypothetical protein E2320_015334 [Naja naja]|nr:hypothetical protein E2320_015334 [Naja naja]
MVKMETGMWQDTLIYRLKLTLFYRFNSTDIKDIFQRFSPMYLLSLGYEQARVTLKQHLFGTDRQTDTGNTIQLSKAESRRHFLAAAMSLTQFNIPNQRRAFILA